MPSATVFRWWRSERVEEDSVSEVGCIHTCQGLELDYVGVIIGPDLVYRDGAIVANPAARDRRDKTMKGWKKLTKSDLGKLRGGLRPSSRTRTEP